jgi:hypothetical protein
MLLKSEIEIPDNCPMTCPFKKEAFYQGNMCSRCPIFNCRKVPDSDGYFQLMKPEEYRENWAKEFKLLFDSLEKDPKNYHYPKLYF